MGHIIERQPPARALLAGIRAIGYSFSTAIADIIDNSISAQANRIDVISEVTAERTFVEFLDNGKGMVDLYIFIWSCTSIQYTAINIIWAL